MKDTTAQSKVRCQLPNKFMSTSIPEPLPDSSQDYTSIIVIVIVAIFLITVFPLIFRVRVFIQRITRPKIIVNESSSLNIDISENTSPFPPPSPNLLKVPARIKGTLASRKMVESLTDLESGAAENMNINHFICYDNFDNLKDPNKEGSVTTIKEPKILN